MIDHSLNRPKNTATRKARMDQASKETYETESGSIPPDSIIDDIIQSIEKVDREIERFYQIHRTELTAKDDD